MDVIGPVVSAERFTWSRKNKTATAFISDFGRDVRVWGKLFSDACDEGFQIISPKSNKSVAFYLHDTEENDGEIKCWNFYSIYNRDMAGWRVVIFND